MIITCTKHSTRTTTPLISISEQCLLVSTSIFLFYMCDSSTPILQITTFYLSLGKHIAMYSIRTLFQLDTHNIFHCPFNSRDTILICLRASLIFQFNAEIFAIVWGIGARRQKSTFPGYTAMEFKLIQAKPPQGHQL